MTTIPKITHTNGRFEYAKNSEINFSSRVVASKIRPSLLDIESTKIVDVYRKKYDYKTKKPLQWGIKRFLDYTVAAGAIILASPIMLLAAAAIKLDSKGPVVFKQTRIGLGGKPFTIYKFRSMASHDDQLFLAGKYKNDPRVTKVGKFIRKFSIDETLQFFNILKGDMSLIGPRPNTIKYQTVLDKEDPNNIKRYAIMQGAMIHYPRNKERTAQDIISKDDDYISNWSLQKDFKEFFNVLKDITAGKNY